MRIKLDSSDIEYELETRGNHYSPGYYLNFLKKYEPVTLVYHDAIVIKNGKRTRRFESLEKNNITFFKEQSKWQKYSETIFLGLSVFFLFFCLVLLIAGSLRNNH